MAEFVLDSLGLPLRRIVSESLDTRIESETVGVFIVLVLVLSAGV